MGSVGLSNISAVRDEAEKLWPPNPFGGSLHEGLPDVIGDTSCNITCPQYLQSLSQNSAYDMQYEYLLQTIPTELNKCIVEF